MTDSPRRPAVPHRLLVVADRMSGPVWNGDSGTPVDLDELPLTDDLRRELRNWAAAGRPVAARPDVQRAHQDWQLVGLDLALRVQREVGPEVQVEYVEAGITGATDSNSAIDGAYQSSLTVTFGPGQPAPELPWLTSPLSDRTDISLAELRRRAVDPVVEALLTRDELDALVVYRLPWPDGRRTADTAGEVMVWLSARGEQFNAFLLPAGEPIPENLTTVAAPLADSLEDFVAESGFAWGEQRVARYTLPS